MILFERDSEGEAEAGVVVGGYGDRAATFFLPEFDGDSATGVIEEPDVVDAEAEISRSDGRLGGAAIGIRLAAGKRGITEDRSELNGEGLRSGSDENGESEEEKEEHLFRL